MIHGYRATLYRSRVGERKTRLQVFRRIYRRWPRYSRVTRPIHQAAIERRVARLRAIFADERGDDGAVV